ncbi:MAG: hypothetical protein PVF05_08060 [Gemmatimonadales bacterium]|jgi:hypothetical protein
MAREFMDDEMMRWEAYVSGGQPDGPKAARIYFLSLDSPLARARYVAHESRKVATAERELRAMSDDDLRELLAASTPND